MFQSRLDKIKSAALWLDSITVAHSEYEKKLTKRINIVSENMVFLETRLCEEKLKRGDLKKENFESRREFDSLYH